MTIIRSRHYRFWAARFPEVGSSKTSSSAAISSTGNGSAFNRAMRTESTTLSSIGCARVARIVPFSRSSITLTPTIRTCRRRNSPVVSGYALLPCRDFQLLTDFSHLKTTVSARDVVMARDCYDDCIAYLDDQLGRLLESLKSQGLLDQTVVIITSDHGESFGVHGVFGHGGSLYLDEVAVPLVILLPGIAADVVADPVSLRDLPATVVDQLGLTAGSPFPGHSLSTLWRSLPGRSAAETSPAFSELAHPIAFEPQDASALSRRGVQMSLVASKRHYIRDGSGAERLYDLTIDPYEMNNLIGSAPGDKFVMDFRRMLKKLLTNNPGSIAVENAYLKAYRKWLESSVDNSQTERPANPGILN